MELEKRQSRLPTTPQIPEFAQPPSRESMELRLSIPLESKAEEAEATEASLPSMAIETVETAKQGRLSAIVKAASKAASAYFTELAETEFARISDTELQPARIQIGLTFIGFSALALVFLLVYIISLHPDMSALERVRYYWYQYILFVSLGVTGMFMLARESIRPKSQPVDDSEKKIKS
ncbi:MAG: hypothetical protein N3E45_05985 [Oscillatoriaceae bacterium SKW80]|nr:hypothetical protein [Oscillatoriaceae bacterium SKYG93]MCX8120364.1 hypothetical protein [Oscillatoriaceae bacterium SKW80]MDW8453290.1 hypothetical protein [Oscillatoriaceae cyanobacterium SKYGB_i_bin93]HIK27268.1 hypothetical protein [Oscillatoriaceae cyanobacterium M7585_C2015_266]